MSSGDSDGSVRGGQESPSGADGRPLAGQVVVVTGGARAIGREIAVRIAAAGAAVAILDLENSEETIEAVRSRGAEAMALRADVSDPETVGQAMSTVAGLMGRIDGLVNNAGLYVSLERRPFWEIPAEEWDRVMAVNTRSVFICSAAVVPHMRQRSGGRIVNISSDVVTFGMPNLLHYVASKGAVSTMTRSMARELGPFGIGVNSVGPGLVTTEITEQTIPEVYRKEIAAEQCIAELIRPADVAATVAFLLSPAARMISGQTVLVNGGASMGGV
ncbi:MAG TPA: SDR family oxidoreductase [Acidimicrobiales bacterium]|nr:SDR family oxidoreductase [Acidimicrobiales bacterium]